MVVRSAQKEMGDVQRIREAMEGNRPVVTAGQRELIIQQANITGEDGAGMVEDIEDAAANNKMLPADSGPSAWVRYGVEFLPATILSVLSLSVFSLCFLFPSFPQLSL